MTPQAAKLADAGVSEQNQAGLCRELERVYAALTRGAAPETSAPPAYALEHLTQTFGLTDFERDVLLLCAGCELEGRFGETCAALNNDERVPWPTLSMAFSVLPKAHWAAAGPEAPLRYWNLIEISKGAGLVRAPLKISERILHYLTGIPCLEDRLTPLVRRIHPGAASNPGVYRDCAAQLVTYWQNDNSLPALLAAKRSSAQRLVAEEVSRIAGNPCYAMRASDIPTGTEERALVARLWRREALLNGALLFIGTRRHAPRKRAGLSAFARTLRGRRRHRRGSPRRLRVGSGWRAALCRYLL